MQLSPELLGLIIVIVVLFVMLVLNFTGLFPIFRWVAEYFDLRKREAKIEELEYLDEVGKENLKNINSYISFQVSSLSHNLKIPAPSADLQVTVNNFSMFDINLKKFIYQPSISGIKSTLDERSHDKEVKIPHQNTAYLDIRFTIPDGIAEYLENCKRKANNGEHGKLMWNFKCTAYFLVRDSKVKKNQTIRFTKEWYEIELPSKRSAN